MPGVTPQLKSIDLCSDLPVRLVRPSLPPLEALQGYLEEIWESRYLTNFGPIHARLEAALAEYLGTPHISLVSNATLGTIAVMRVLEVGRKEAGGEIVTTPFSFVATSNAIRLSGLEPVFADIDPFTLSVSPEAVERAITPSTRGILAVHAFGIPAHVEALAEIAERHAIPLIYDAAHAFGVRSGKASLPAFGDYSVLSFHATKVFNTFEGGAVISPTAEAKRAIDQFCNHGIEDEGDIPLVGLNAKMSELHAAVGLAQLPYVDGDIAARRAIATGYCDALRDMEGIRCVCPMNCAGHNFYAFPILVEDGFGLSRDALFARFAEADILTRRYFHPLLSDLPAFRDLPSAAPGSLPAAQYASERILCLPLHPDLTSEEQRRVIDVLLSV